MALDPVTGILEVGARLIDRLWPDAAQRDAAKLELLKAQQAGDLADLDAQVRLALGQMEVNKAEATAGGFASGWRPSAGYICVAGMGYSFLLQPLLPWIARMLGADVPPLPELDNGELMTLLGGLLGLGGFRAFEKARGVAR